MSYDVHALLLFKWKGFHGKGSDDSVMERSLCRKIQRLGLSNSIELGSFQLPLINIKAYFLIAILPLSRSKSASDIFIIYPSVGSYSAQAGNLEVMGATFASTRIFGSENQ
jgi:hypothetical protein